MYAEKHYSSIHLVLSIKLGPLYTRNPGKNIFILYCVNIVSLLPVIRRQNYTRWGLLESIQSVAYLAL